MTVHQAAQAFDGAAGVYERARPGYPPAAVDVLVSALGAGEGAAVVDLAAGTGKLTRLLVPRGLRVVAVEPVAGMRAELARAVPGVPAAGGTAESLPVRTGAVDGVVVAQAFHWFDGRRALAEIRRVLRPGGVLALAWNVRDRTAAWVRRVGDLTDAHAPAMPRFRTGEWRRAFGGDSGFGPLQSARVPHVHEVDAPTMLGRIASISWIAGLPEGDRRRLLDEVRAVLDDLPERFPVPYHTELFWCRALPA